MHEKELLRRNEELNIGKNNSKIVENKLRIS